MQLLNKQNPVALCSMESHRATTLVPHLSVEHFGICCRASSFFPPGSVGVGDARVRCAVSKGTMLDTDKVAKDLRGVAGWISAGQLRFVLTAMPAYFHRIAGAARSNTFTICTVLAAQTSGL